jgi:ribosomal protein S12 methylthiotransferase accessory factor YcaO
LVARSDLKKQARLVHGAIALHGAAVESASDRISFVDLDKADVALAKFRESVQNASLYERGWHQSGVQPVVDWLSSLRTETGALDPSLKTLIEALVDSAETSVLTEENRRILEQ